MMESGVVELIGELYDAASGAASFAPLAGKIAAAFNSGDCALQVRNGFAGPIENLTVTPTYTVDLITSYNSYSQYNITASCGTSHGPGSVLGPSGIGTESKCRETPIYRQHISAVQSFYHFDVILPIGGPEGAYGILGIHRREMESPFSSEEKRFGEIFLPQLKRALQLREHLARVSMRHQAMVQTTENLALGVMLVTSLGQVQFANAAAENLLRRGSGLVLTQNRLHATTPSVDHEFQRLLKCTNPANDRELDASGLIRLPRRDAKPLSLSIYPFRAPANSNADRTSSVLIFIGDPDLHKPPRREALAKMYDLTGAEAKLFEALLAGERLQDYADRCSIGLQTVKTQLKCLFNKTGSTRQTDLVRDGLSNPILSLTNDDHSQERLASKSFYNSVPRSRDMKREFRI